jgi:hypothetical protein
MLPGKSAVKVSRQMAQSSSSSSAPALTPVAAAPVAMAATANGAEACEEATGAVAAAETGAAACGATAAAAAAVLPEPLAAAAGSAGELEVVNKGLAESRRKKDPTRPLMREAAALATAVAVAAAEAAGDGVVAPDAADVVDPGVAAVPAVASELDADVAVALGSGVIANVSRFFQLESGTESARAAPPSLLRISNEVVPSPKVDVAFLRKVATVSLAGTDTNVASLPGQESTN